MVASASTLALSAAPAQAVHGLPEFGRCIKLPIHDRGGDYSSPRCIGEVDPTFMSSFSWKDLVRVVNESM